MKITCDECGMRWKDENTSKCEYCGKPICFQCRNEHEEMCKKYNKKKSIIINLYGIYKSIRIVLFFLWLAFNRLPNDFNARLIVILIPILFILLNLILMILVLKRNKIFFIFFIINYFILFVWAISTGLFENLIFENIAPIIFELLIETFFLIKLYKQKNEFR
jgi:hypothetical protein